MELKPLWREIPRIEHLKLTQTLKVLLLVGFAGDKG